MKIKDGERKVKWRELLKQKMTGMGAIGQELLRYTYWVLLMGGAME